MIVFTRAVPVSLARCELTHLSRDHIDVARAAAEHRRLEHLLKELGCRLKRVMPAPALPDSAFVEDAAVVLPEVAILARPGASSRRHEVAGVAEALRSYRPLVCLTRPATLDGGDVLRVGDRIFVGRSGRTNEEGIRQLAAIVKPLGYDVTPVPVEACLHLKTGVSQVASGTLLINPKWIDTGAFADCATIEIHPEEPYAANALRVGNGVVYPVHFPRTRKRLEDSGVGVHTVELSELSKAEAGVTCCCILLEE